MDVDEDNEEEGWHLDAEEDEIEDAMDVEEIVKEWQMSVPFINRGMKHPCTQFADEPYFRKPPRIDEQFGVGQ
jgi:hypothetical protein